MSDDITQVGSVVSALKTSEIVETGDISEGAEGDRAGVCWFNGTRYSEGAFVCSSGKRLRCAWNGTWTDHSSC
mgnify:CR=1 FL=1